jgi:hypothetical protein
VRYGVSATLPMFPAILDPGVRVARAVERECAVHVGSDPSRLDTVLRQRNRHDVGVPAEADQREHLAAEPPAALRAPRIVTTGGDAREHA